MIIDSHCHINTERFDADRAETVTRARDAGVRRMIVIGAAGSLDCCRSAIAMAEADDGIRATVGVHPHDAKACDEATYAAIREMADHPQVIAIGETGLDFYYDSSPREEQIEAFRRFIRMAREVDLPLVLHVRDAHAEALRVAEEEGAAEVGGVVHCFTGTAEEARAWLGLGFHLGITGIVTFKNSGELPQVVTEAPLERLLVETDSPYLAPTPFRGKRNEPAYVVKVVEKLAELRDEPVERVASQTAANTARVFRWAL